MSQKFEPKLTPLSPLTFLNGCLLTPWDLASLKGIPPSTYLCDVICERSLKWWSCFYQRNFFSLWGLFRFFLKILVLLILLTVYFVYQQNKESSVPWGLQEVTTLFLIWKKLKIFRIFKIFIKVMVRSNSSKLIYFSELYKTRQ